MTKADATKETAPVAGSSDRQREPKPPEHREGDRGAKAVARASLPPEDGISGEGRGAAGRARMSIAMQRSLGNGRIARMALDPHPPRHPDSTSAGDPLKTIQTKLTVNEPGDSYEREADSVAEKISTKREQPAPVARVTRTQPGGPSEVKRRPAAPEEPASGGMDSSMESRIQSPSGGRPLDPGMRRDMEAGLGTDLAHVRVHDGARDRADADRLNAKAFTHGSDIWIGSHGSPDDRKLMAHELTHVVQQTGTVQRQPADSEAETEAPPSDFGDEPEGTAEETAPQQGEDRAAAPANATALPDQPAPEAPAATPTPATANAAAPGMPAAAVTPAAAPASGAPESAPQTAEPQSTATPEAPSPDASHPGAAAMPETQPAPSAVPEPVPEAAAPAAAPLPEAVPAPASSAIPTAAAPTLQRDDDDDTGILASIRRRFTGIVDSLRSGWTALASMAQSAFDAVRGQITAAVGMLTGLITGALAALQSVWAAISQRVTQVVNSFRQIVGVALSPITGAIQQMRAAFLRLDPIGLNGVWNRIKGVISTIQQRVQQQLDALLRGVMSLFTGLRARFDSILNSLSSTARNIYARVQSAVDSLSQRISAAWDGLRNRASQMSGVLEGILDRLRSLLSSLISWGEELWNSIQAQWRSLSATIGAFFQTVWRGLEAAAQALRARAMSLWNRLVALWNRLLAWARQQMQRFIGGIRSLWAAIQNLSIAKVVSKLAAISRIYQALTQIVEDVRGFFTPFAAAITNRVYAGMPQRATGWAHQQVNRVLGPTPENPVQAQDTTPAPGDTTVQRAPRSTASLSDIWTGFWGAIKAMWAALTWKSFFDMVLQTLLEQLFPPLAGYRQMKAFITEDLPALWDGLFTPRNPLRDPLGFLHDIWTMVLHFVTDFVLALVRRFITYLMSWMFWITVILTIAGAIGGATVVAVFGAILGFFAGFGVGAGPGAAGGAAAGGAAGAGVGFGIALLIGEAMFFAFLAAHLVTVEVLLLQLLTGNQTEDEKNRDYKQLAESAVAIGVGLILLFIGWLAGVVAEAVSALLSKLGLRLPPAISRFLRGAGSVRKPGAGEPTAAERAAALAAEQRLAPQVGGALARDLVADLGPEAAEALVARVGANNVRRLGAELKPTAIVAVARGLSPDAIDRLLNGGMRPVRLRVAVLAEQGPRMEALPANQIGPLARLSDDGFNRIINLPEANFQRYATLTEPQLRAFAGMDEAAFNRFNVLDDTAFVRFRGLNAGQIDAFAAMSDDAFARFVALDAGDFAKFSGFNPAALTRFAGLSNDAFARFAALPATDLAKFATTTTPTMERLAALGPGELENLATQSAAEIHRQVLGRDPAIGGRFRATEADTALRLEAQRGITLDRYVPGAGGKGDWYDVNTGKVYDGCSPPQSRFFNQQIANGNYERSLVDHLASPTVDFVVVDITGLGLTTGQETALDAVILRVAGPANPKIVRIP